MTAPCLWLIPAAPRPRSLVVQAPVHATRNLTVRMWTPRLNKTTLMKCCHWWSLFDGCFKLGCIVLGLFQNENDLRDSGAMLYQLSYEASLEAGQVRVQFFPVIRVRWCSYMYDINHIYELQIKDRSESDLRSCEATFKSSFLGAFFAAVVSQLRTSLSLLFFYFHL